MQEELLASNYKNNLRQDSSMAKQKTKNADGFQNKPTSLVGRENLSEDSNKSTFDIAFHLESLFLCRRCTTPIESASTHLHCIYR